MPAEFLRQKAEGLRRSANGNIGEAERLELEAKGLRADADDLLAKAGACAAAADILDPHPPEVALAA